LSEAGKPGHDGGEPE